MSQDTSDPRYVVGSVAFGTYDPAAAMRNRVLPVGVGKPEENAAPRMTEPQAPKDTALLPCPYCKSAVRMRRESGVTGKVSRSRFYRERVVCTNENCRASGPVGKSPNSTVARWNRFAAPKTDALDPSTALVQSNRERDQAQDWRTMESAPKDKTKILVTRAGTTWVEIAAHAQHKHRGHPWRCGHSTGSVTHYEPTHWMPLPAPPVLSSLPPSPSKEEG